MEVLLTPAAPGEAEGIRGLMARAIVTSVTADEALRRETIANVNGNVEYWLSYPERCVHLKATLLDRLVGVVLVKDFWNLCSLFVDPSVQSKGIGRSLVEAASAECKNKSPKQALFLNAAANAVGFYERLGFTPRESTQRLPPGFMAMKRSL